MSQTILREAGKPIDRASFDRLIDIPLPHSESAFSQRFDCLFG
jgi:hypothetical protein